MDKEIKAEEFVPFPAARQQQIEQHRKSAEGYQSPHHPRNKMPIVGADMKTNYELPAGAVQSRPTPQEVVASPAYVNAQIVASAPTVPVAAPGYTTPTSEEEAVLVALPSNFAFYDFKDLYIKPFKGRHLAKLSRAREEGSTLYTVEAVSSVLSTPQGHNNLGFKLTVPDFYYILYWLRLNSFTKTSFLHKSTCTDDAHVEKVAKGEMLPDTLKAAEVISRANLKETFLTEIPNKELFKLDYPNAEVKICTMQDAMEMTEDPDFVSEEFRFAAEIACYLQIPDVQSGDGSYRPATLRERIVIVDDMSPDDIRTIKAYEKAVTDYGITETIDVTCKHCGAKRREAIVLDAHSFFQ